MVETKKYKISTSKNICPLGHRTSKVENKSTGNKFYTCDTCGKNYEVGEIEG